MSALEFQINLSGNLTTALGRAGQELDKTGERAKRAKHEFEVFEGEIGKLSGSIGGLGINLSAFAHGGSLFTFDLAEGLRGLVELSHKVVEGLVDLGKEAIGVAAKTQDLNLAIRLNVGDAKAKEVDELAESFERTTRFDASDLKQAFLPLLKVGVADKEALDTFGTIATDLAARGNNTIGEVQETLSKFAGIFQRGRVKPAQLAQFGIRADEYFKALGATFGKTTEEAEKLAKKGKFTGDQLAQVAARLIASRQGGAIGQPSLEAAKTLGATLQRLGNVKENLFEKLADSPGIKAVQGFLDNFIATMRGPIGDELVGELSNAFSALFGDLSGPEGAKKLQGAVRLVADEARSFVADFKKAWPEIKTAIEGVVFVVEKLAKGLLLAGEALEKLTPSHGKALAAKIASGSALDVVTQDDLAERAGIGAGTRALAKAFRFVGLAGYSPDELARIQGQAKIEGLQIPKLAAGGIVTRPTLALIGESGPEAVVPLSDPGLSSSTLGARGGARGDVSVNVGGITVVLHGVQDGKEAGLEAAQTVRVELKKLLDEVGWTYGATVVE